MDSTVLGNNRSTNKMSWMVLRPVVAIFITILCAAACSAYEWDVQASQALMTMGIIPEDGLGFTPLNSQTIRLTRAQTAALIARFKNGGKPLPSVGGLPGGFTDVQNFQWYSQAIAFVKANSLMDGDKAGKFNPFSRVTMADFSAALIRALLGADACKNMVYPFDFIAKMHSLGLSVGMELNFYDEVPQSKGFEMIKRALYLTDAKLFGGSGQRTVAERVFGLNSAVVRVVSMKQNPIAVLGKPSASVTRDMLVESGGALADIAYDGVSEQMLGTMLQVLYIGGSGRVSSGDKIISAERLTHQVSVSANELNITESGGSLVRCSLKTGSKMVIYDGAWPETLYLNSGLVTDKAVRQELAKRLLYPDGSLYTAVDNNNDGKADCVFINERLNGVVYAASGKHIDISGMNLGGLSPGSVPEGLKKNDYVIVTINRALKTYSVSLAQGVTGLVTESGGGRLTVDGVIYKCVRDFTPPLPGSRYIIVLDAAGNACMAERSGDTAPAPARIIIPTSIIKKPGAGPVYIVTAVDEDGKWVTLEVSTGVMSPELVDLTTGEAKLEHMYNNILSYQASPDGRVRSLTALGVAQTGIVTANFDARTRILDYPGASYYVPDNALIFVNDPLSGRISVNVGLGKNLVEFRSVKLKFIKIACSQGDVPVLRAMMIDTKESFFDTGKATAKSALIPVYVKECGAVRLQDPDNPLLIADGIALLTDLSEIRMLTAGAYDVGTLKALEKAVGTYKLAVIENGRVVGFKPLEENGYTVLSNARVVACDGKTMKISHSGTNYTFTLAMDTGYYTVDAGRRERGSQSDIRASSAEYYYVTVIIYKNQIVPSLVFIQKQRDYYVD